ncbi:MAG: hypothetical protein DHS20C17_04620 [Cyclobacteriaceae bacterium]|nr:MAG: hypothetical protein DHS20C17_04620 [Cyclobacteriaceae bacterium]
MNSVYATILMSALFLGCASSHPAGTLRPPAENMIDLSQKEEGEEYELIVMDPGFENWFQTTWNIGKDRSVNYYSHWNNMYVSAWNYKATHPHYSQFFDTMINYQPTIDYGIELERKLYYYFRWVDTKKGVPILDTRPPGAI